MVGVGLRKHFSLSVLFLHGANSMAVVKLQIMPPHSLSGRTGTTSRHIVSSCLQLEKFITLYSILVSLESID